MKLTRHGQEVLLRATNDPYCTVCPQLQMDFADDLGWREYHCGIDKIILECLDEPMRSERCYKEAELVKS